MRDAAPVLDLLRLEAVVLGRELQRELALVVEEEARVRERALQLADLLLARARLPAQPVQLGALRLGVAQAREQLAPLRLEARDLAAVEGQQLGGRRRVLREELEVEAAHGGRGKSTTSGEGNCLDRT